MSRVTPPRRGRSWSERIYRVLLHAYSPRFRREAGTDLEEMFHDAYADACARRGTGHLPRLWIRTILDLAVTALPERIAWIARRPRRIAVNRPTRTMKRTGSMETTLQDIRYALRNLRKSPGFVAVAVISLALGIGANTTIFTVINAVFLNPLPVEEPSRLVNLYTDDEGVAGGFIAIPVSYLNYQDYRDQNDVLSGLAAFIPFQFTVNPGEEPQQVTGMLATGNYFDVLGVSAQIGRTFSFTPSEDRQLGGHPVAVISHSLWSRMFGSDPTVVGRSVSVNSYPFTIVGVTPPNFKGTFALGNPDQIWIPVSMYREMVPLPFHSFLESRRALAMNPFGRLRPGVSQQQAAAELKTIAARLAQEYPNDNENRTVRLESVADAAVGIDQRQSMIRTSGVLMTVVGLVLLIACANLANLLLARGATRAKEIGIRAALGANRRRLIRQLLTESVLIALAGGVAGIFVAHWGRDLIWSFRPAFLDQNAIELALDGRVLAFTLGVSVATGIAFGLLPALRASLTDVQQTLNVAGRSEWSGWGRSRLRHLLVAGEVALTLVALVGAGLFLRSMQEAQSIDPGFESSNMMVMGVNPSSAGYTPEQTEQYFRDVVLRAGAAPGARSAAIADAFPLGGGFQQTVVLEGEDPSQRGRLSYTINVSPGYLETLGIPLLRGRGLTEFDRADTRRVAVINEAMARRYWEGQDPIGQRFSFISTPDQVVEVVGVVPTVAMTAVGEDPQPAAYLPIEQNPTAFGVIHVRTVGDPANFAGPIQSEIRDLDRDIALINSTTIGNVLSAALWPRRMAAGLLAFFGLLALIIAAVGVYGVMSYSANQRRHEIGIRMAVGATTASVLSLVLRQGVLIAGAGAAVGLVASLALSRAVASLLYGVSATDPLTFGTIAALIMLVAAVASYLPARRAAKVDPLVVLRSE
ncbi:MAG: ABC transporter permease, partial [Gemmatimonadota bacterium]